ncbi:MAG: NAD(P)H-quinone oxidoreductase [Pseudomonadota bacterium]|nr:NAD(P)H-quinone oxidoreductase [Pseudomonadota bacterium]
MNIPNEMKAIDIKQPGGPEVLIPVTVPIPKISDSEVLVKNQAVGVTRPDIAQRTGTYPVPADANPLPGLEVAGEVVAVGENSGDWSIGDKVTALTHGGGYAEYTAIHHSHCLPWPAGFDAVLSAGIPETYFTVYYNVFTRAALKSGEKILVHGGSSGIGHAAIKLAKSFGASVITTAGTSEKCKFCEEAGADKAINYKEEDWEEETKAFSNGGVNVVLDIVAGEYVQKNLNLLCRDGRYVSLALLGGAKAEINMGRILRNRITLSGSTLRPQTTEEKGIIAEDLRKEVWPLFETKQIQPHIHQVFSLEEASKAHMLMETSKHMGKIILKVDS